MRRRRKRCFRLPDPCQCATISTVTLRLTYYRPAARASIEKPHFPLAFRAVCSLSASGTQPDLDSESEDFLQVCQLESLPVLDRWTHRYQIGTLFGSNLLKLLVVLRTQAHWPAAVHWLRA
jgi:hypothetical protein